MNLLSILAATKAASATSGITMMIIYVVFIGGFARAVQPDTP